jgi:hypothetical protein
MTNAAHVRQCKPTRRGVIDRVNGYTRVLTLRAAESYFAPLISGDAGTETYPQNVGACLQAIP